MVKFCFSINVDPNDYAKINCLAQQKGLGVATMARTILREALGQIELPEGVDLEKFKHRRKYRNKEIVDKNQMEITDIVK